MSVYDINGVSILNQNIIKFELGGIEPNGSLSNTITTSIFRSEKMYKCSSGKDRIVFKTNGIIDSAFVYFYSQDGNFINIAQLEILNSSSVFAVPNNAKYIKISINMSNVDSVIAFYGGGEVFNPNIINTNIGTSTAFIYKVSKNSYTSGRLLLPPNYSITGESVPLIVFGHGSGGMSTWNKALGYAGSDADYRPFLQYLANEGFAVFDCYPWTNKEALADSVWSPYETQCNFQSYLEGIKYCCSRFNVNINKVNLLCKSQGGHLGHWACTQTIFPFKTVSLFAPSYGIGRNSIAFDEKLRYALTKYVEFYGTNEEITAFINSGNYADSTVKSFVDKNKVQFVNMMPFAHGVTNGSIDELFTYGVSANLGTVPQWMLDEGLPAKPSGAIGIGAFAAKKTYIKTSYYPVKFWCAFDDDATSSYSNYAICHWLQNGGSDALFRELPLNTGGHHAMDTSPTALKSSGTTALGIQYTDIPTAYVEVVEFIRLKCGD